MDNCSWWGPGYWVGWFWAGRIVWLLLLAAIGFFVFLAVRKSRRSPNENHGIGLSTRPIMQGKCPVCGEPVEQAYLRCPECHHQLKLNCPSCGKLVKTTWEICPYCEVQLTETSQTRVHH